MSIAKQRIESLDLIKGLVIVVMAIDHVRDYFHYSSYFFDPTDPTLTTIPLFLTRFITHFCAPAFSFLAGVSAFIIGRRKTTNELSQFLLKRGLWLIFVELVIMDFGWCFDITFRLVSFGVIWSLGISMIFLAALIQLPKKAILIFSCLLIFGHNLLDNIHFDNSILWTLLHERKPLLTTPNHVFRSGYAIVPWVAVMSLGYYFGSFYDNTYDPLKRRKLFNTIGIAAIMLFVVLRGLNIYGNLLPWTAFANLEQTVFSFLNLTKYPPSLSFLLVTLGGAFLFLANSENLRYLIWAFIIILLYPLCKKFDTYKQQNKQKWWLSYL